MACESWSQGGGIYMSAEVNLVQPLGARAVHQHHVTSSSAPNFVRLPEITWRLLPRRAFPRLFGWIILVSIVKVDCLHCLHNVQSQTRTSVASRDRAFTLRSAKPAKATRSSFALSRDPLTDLCNRMVAALARLTRAGSNNHNTNQTQTSYPAL